MCVCVCRDRQGIRWETNANLAVKQSNLIRNDTAWVEARVSSTQAQGGYGHRLAQEHAARVRGGEGRGGEEGSGHLVCLF